MNFIDNLYIAICLLAGRAKEKTKEFFESQDGISNIVSTVLLVLVVVLLIGLLWGFLSGWLGDLVKKVKDGGNEVTTAGSW